MTNVTSSSAADAKAGPQSSIAPLRRAPNSPLRRTSEIVLVAGTVIAVVAAFGPTWLVRVGVVVAVVAAVVACAFAWRELFAVRRRHAKDMLLASQQHGLVLREERTRTGAVVDTLTKRVTDAGAVIDGQRVVIATLRTEVSGLNGDRAHLRSEIEHRETVITSLRETVRSREAELIALHDEGGEASVHHLPRRVLAEHESAWAEVPDADELWRDGSHPTVVDMVLIDTAMVLPNYEVDRLVG